MNGLESNNMNNDINSSSSTTNNKTKKQERASKKEQKKKKRKRQCKSDRSSRERRSIKENANLAESTSKSERIINGNRNANVVESPSKSDRGDREFENIKKNVGPPTSPKNVPPSSPNMPHHQTKGRIADPTEHPATISPPLPKTRHQHGTTPAIAGTSPTSRLGIEGECEFELVPSILDLMINKKEFRKEELQQKLVFLEEEIHQLNLLKEKHEAASEKKKKKQQQRAALLSSPLTTNKRDEREGYSAKRRKRKSLLSSPCPTSANQPPEEAMPSPFNANVLQQEPASSGKAPRSLTSGSKAMGSSGTNDNPIIGRPEGTNSSYKSTKEVVGDKEEQAFIDSANKSEKQQKEGQPQKNSYAEIKTTKAAQEQPEELRLEKFAAEQSSPSTNASKKGSPSERRLNKDPKEQRKQKQKKEEIALLVPTIADEDWEGSCEDEDNSSYSSSNSSDDSDYEEDEV